ncbi:MAG TPA: extracellular solute-binding protein [Candidatus Dormibacteraeota bacterium]|jgi:putative spermidine/putrescine transport system substrate-binding protein|nr:extracellular solute-binding protein [Candidatus Dormibacteraeota bacterium]
MKFRPWTLAAIAVVALIGAACGGTGTTAAPGPSASGLSGSFTFYLSGDVNIQHLWLDTLIPDYQKANPGVHVNLVFSAHGVEDVTTLAKLSQSAQSGQYSGFDLIEGGLVKDAAQSNLLTRITTAEVPRSAEIDPNQFTAVQHNAMPYRGSKVLLAYDSSRVKNPPRTLGDLLAWIKAHPGLFDYNVPSGGGSGQAFVEAVLNQYVPKDDQQKMGLGYVPELEGEWNRGFQQLKSLGPDIYQHGVYPASQDQVYQLLGNGTIAMCPVWSDQALTALKSGQFPPTVKLTEISPPLYGGPAYLGVPKVTPHKKLVFSFMNFLLGQAEQVKIVDQIQGLPGIEMSHMPASVQRRFSSLGTTQSLPYSAKMAADLNRLWQSSVPG